MAKKSKSAKAKMTVKDYNRSPFKSLKGFAASETVEPHKVQPQLTNRESYGSFADEMELLGVQQLKRDEVVSEEEITFSLSVDSGIETGGELNDDDLFLAAMGELPDLLDDRSVEERAARMAMPQRMKQLKQGKLAPDASINLHGCLRSEVGEKLQNFLHNARYHGWRILLVITGKGLHSQGGEAVVRDEVERFLASVGNSQIVEWGRAPKQYGGSGALILFLRKSLVMDSGEIQGK